MSARISGDMTVEEKSCRIDFAAARHFRRAGFRYMATRRAIDDVVFVNVYEFIGIGFDFRRTTTCSRISAFIIFLL